MEIWWLENQDCSGAFSTKEKAIASLKHCAKRCGWRNLHVIGAGEEYTSYAYEWRDKDGTWHYADDVFIARYILDEDNE